MRKLDQFPFKFNNKEQNHLYTKGKQFSINGIEYIGEYHLVNKKPFTGPESSDFSEPLTVYYSNHDHYSYDSLIIGTNKTFVKVFGQPIPFIPNPTSSDYDIGIIERFFVKDQFFKDAYGIEISKQYFDNINSESVVGSINGARYISVGIQWKISGLRFDLFEFNKDQILIGSRVINDLAYVLPNVLQFAKI